MLKGIAYWTYYFVNKNPRLRKDGGVRSDAAMIVVLLMWFNWLSMLLIVNYFVGDDAITSHLPTMSRYKFSSWIIVSIIYIPVAWMVYHRYYAKDKIKALADHFKAKTPRQRLYSQLLYWLYCAISVIGFFLLAACIH